ncbi:hypothetical protein LC065_15445 [Halobacillus litoralis]|uniref:hypothetical protein n=1 Tax=Halobacillus litoralis TaxID=45668 RepID=UPI001CFE5F85|nr:hypothetical protein [Halobacillus litoralis]WLR46928.1 hypothetical protein LC065_15445 [Halobacillus litoralis]
MMNGTLLWNLWTAVFGFLFIFLISAQVTTFDTAVYRGTIGFFSFFGISYVFRTLWSFVAAPVDTAEDHHNWAQSASYTDMDAEETSEMVRKLLNEDA